MDKQEASELLQNELAGLRQKPYDELVELIGNSQAYELTGSSGINYQFELDVFWDDPRKPGGNLRVMLSIDDGRFPAAFLPLTNDFILEPDEGKRI
jgi:hypothetical protein